MYAYFNLFGRTIFLYGVMIVSGVILANLIALRLINKNHHDINAFIIIEAYIFGGAFIGAKLLYFLVSFNDIEWKNMLNITYFNSQMQGGFVFYGGLIGGLLFALLAGKIHKIPVKEYIINYIFLIPFIHSFGRIGCFMAGCCYGIPYNGIGAIIFPKNPFFAELSGIPRFPVQLVEAFALLIISLLILYLQLFRESKDTVETYFILYGIIRFVLEYFRGDIVRGKLGIFTTSQWLGILLSMSALAILVYKIYHDKLYGKTNAE